MPFGENKTTTRNILTGEARVKTEDVGAPKKRIDSYQRFYKDPPSGTIPLKEFERVAVERLKVLKALELSRTLKKTPAELREQLSELNCVYVKETLQRAADDVDRMSHHILRLAYCKTESNRQWFVDQEVDFMRFRILQSDDKSMDRDRGKISDRIRTILAANQLTDESMSRVDESIKDKYLEWRKASTELFKVNFEEVPQLIRNRSVLIQDGFAYMTSAELLPFLLTKYKLHLKQQMAIMVKRLPYVEEESRIMRQLSALSNGDLGSAYNSSKLRSGDRVSIVDLDSLSLTSFPLCMQALHSGLKTRHHMKHDGRMQYGLFLKGVGLSLEDSLTFWRNEFTKGGIDADKFDKTYSYNIRHNYGKEGKRADYMPHSCMKIITKSAPKSDECHGCPFKHSDDAEVRSLLEKRKLGVAAIEHVMEYKKMGHFQVACMEVFKSSHEGVEIVNGLQHPNQYFDDSRQAVKNKESQVDSTPTPQSQGNVTLTPSRTQPSQTQHDDSMDITQY